MEMNMTEKKNQQVSDIKTNPKHGEIYLSRTFDSFTDAQVDEDPGENQT